MTRGNPEILLEVMLSSVSLRLRSERGWGSMGRTVYLKWEVCKPPHPGEGGVTVGHPVVMPQDIGVARVRRLQTRKIKEDEGS